MWLPGLVSMTCAVGVVKLSWRTCRAFIQTPEHGKLLCGWLSTVLLRGILRQTHAGKTGDQRAIAKH